MSIVLIGGGIYWLHQKEIRQKEMEKKEIEAELAESSHKLLEAFKFIGKANLYLPLISGLTTDLITCFKYDKKSKKNVFDKLLNTATVQIAKIDWGMFRFLDTENQNTIKELVYTSKNYSLLKTQIPNKELVGIQDSKDPVKKINDLHVVTTSDNKARVKCFMIPPESKLTGSEKPILQAIVNQAQLFYQYLYV